MRKPKAHKLPNSTRATIARRYIESKDAGKPVSYISVAEAFNCTAEQVRSAVADYRAGRFAGKLGNKRTGAHVGRAAVAEGAGDTVTLLKAEIAQSILELQTVMLDPVERVQMIQKVTASQKALEQMELHGHMRRTDARIFQEAVRYFMPSATDSDIKRIYQEVLARCRSHA